MNDTHAATLRRRAIIAGIAGNVMEWYDFAVYGYFAQTIGRHFFPAEDATASLIAAFGVFAAGFLMRPFGGAVFGYIGDRIGRKEALILSVLAMAIPTFLIGVLPDHAQIGVTASVLMIILRLVQGVSVGGEYTTSVVFLVEGAPASQRGFMGSWGVFGAVAGILLGSAVGAVTTSFLSAASVYAWGWRIPFLLGLAVGLTGLAIRRHLPETAATSPQDKPITSPVIDAFRSEWRTILQVTGFTVLNAVGFYMMFVYAVTYLEEVVHLQAAAALKINTLNMLVLLLLIPAVGALSDHIGRKPILLIAACGTLFFAWPLFRLMHSAEFSTIFLGQMGFAVLIGLFFGAYPATIVEIFPARVRCSAVSIGYNLCLAVLGGTTPMVATYLITRTHNDLSPAYYLMAAAAVSLFVIMNLRETAKEPLLH